MNICSTRVGGRPPVVDRVDDRIINYELVCSHGDAQIRKLIRDFNYRACMYVWITYRSAILFLYLR